MSEAPKAILIEEKRYRDMWQAASEIISNLNGKKVEKEDPTAIFKRDDEFDLSKLPHGSVVAAEASFAKEEEVGHGLIFPKMGMVGHKITHWFVVIHDEERGKQKMFPILVESDLDYFRSYGVSQHFGSELIVDKKRMNKLSPWPVDVEKDRFKVRDFADNVGGGGYKGAYWAQSGFNEMKVYAPEDSPSIEISQPKSVEEKSGHEVLLENFSKEVKDNRSAEIRLTKEQTEEIIYQVLERSQEIIKSKGVGISLEDLEVTIDETMSISLNVNVVSPIRKSVSLNFNLRSADKDGTLVSEDIKVNPETIGVLFFSYNIAEQVSEKIGGENIDKLFKEQIIGQVDSEEIGIDNLKIFIEGNELVIQGKL